MNPTLYLIVLVVLSLAGWGIKLWLQHTIQESVKHTFAKELEATKAAYARELEQYKTQLKRHEQSILVATILSRALGGSQATHDLNRELWEAQLWLPAPIAQQLSNVLVENATVAGIKDLLVSVRKLLHGADDVMTAEQFVHKNP